MTDKLYYYVKKAYGLSKKEWKSCSIKVKDILLADYDLNPNFRHKLFWTKCLKCGKEIFTVANIRMCSKCRFVNMCPPRISNNDSIFGGKGWGSCKSVNAWIPDHKIGK